MAKSDKKVVFVNRKFTLNRAGHEPLSFNIGANTVDADVADHPFVVAHTVAATDSVDVAGELQSLKDALAVATKRADAAESKVAELQAVIDAAAAMSPTKK
jgi:hypothetical protein